MHFGFGLIALALPWIGRPAGIALAALAACYNGLIAPRLGLDKGYRREGEPWWGGLFTYALAVLVLIVFLDPLLAAAGGWIVMAACDPAAAWAGQRWNAPKVPWCPRKSLVGTLAGAGAAAAMGVALLALHGAPLWPALAAAGAGALVESMPWSDDNLPVGLASGWVYAWALGVSVAG